jgi:hypothetical protein
MNCAPIEVGAVHLKFYNSAVVVCSFNPQLPRWTLLSLRRKATPAHYNHQIRDTISLRRDTASLGGGRFIWEM